MNQQQWLLLLVTMCLVTCHAQQLFSGKIGLPGKDDLKIPTVTGLPGSGLPVVIKGTLGKDGIMGSNCLPGVQALEEKSLTGLATLVLKLQLQQLELRNQISRLERALLLKEIIQKVGGKILATNGKEVDFTTAKTTCESVGGRIATPVNDKENNAILTFVKELNRYAFLGVKEGLLTGKFNYLDGTPVKYTNWSKNEPNGKGQEPCVEMYTDGKWNDKGCNQNRLTICEL
ncbi:pulmonary surfactant-associated protein A [Bombina bombina]|uniref:pulmonary surfactant-associated protein A n=1 Tax=Bombina bombina TaxID=8345 RepID=UPI00235A554F|nr:pulmonary surfactant-associated protein A [Bombina bombina]